MLAAAESDVADALLLLSYPLHPPERPDVLRTAHFPDLRTPALFVHGTHDGFGSIAEMNEAMRLIPAPTELLAVAATGATSEMEADLACPDVATAGTT